MLSRIPDDVSEWLRHCRNKGWTKEEARQLNLVLNGAIGSAIGARLQEKINGRRDRLLNLNLTSPEAVAEATTLQAETKALMVMAETLWEMADVSLVD